MNIREYLDWNSGFAPINKEERNLAAILYHVLLLEDNLSRFLGLVDCPYVVDESEMAIFLEYAYPRDLWSQIGDNETKRGLILALLRPSDADELQDMSVVDFNKHFGAVPTPSTRHIQSPGLWSVSRFDTTIRDDDEFLKTCMFKWAFNAKPDIVIHTSNDQAVCIEAKLVSSEGQYPQSGGEKRIFRSRGVEYVRQTSVQRYQMQTLLGIDTWFVFLVQNTAQRADTHRVVTWKDVFESLAVIGIPDFMAEMISSTGCGADRAAG